MATVRFIERLLDGFQSLETDSTSIENKWNVFTDTGVELDGIGEILNLERTYNETDTDYRERLLSQIAINTSKGDINDLIRVFKLISDATKVRIINHGIGLFAVEINATELYLIDAINIPAGGCRIASLVMYDDSTFTFDDDLLGMDSGELAENIL